MAYKELTFYALGSLNVLTIYDYDDARIDEIIDLIVERIRRIDIAVNQEASNSEVSQINKYAGIKSIKVSFDTLQIIEKGREYALKTNGLFDFLHARRRLFFKAKTDPRDIVIDGYYVGLKKRGQTIDLRDVAKGYCADLTKSLLISEGISEAVVRIDNRVVTLGKKKKIGIQDPFKKDRLLGLLEVEDQAVVTSTKDEQSITLVTESALLGDIYTKIWDEGNSLETEDLVVLNDGRFYMSNRFRKMFIQEV